MIISNYHFQFSFPMIISNYHFQFSFPMIISNYHFQSTENSDKPNIARCLLSFNGVLRRRRPTWNYFIILSQGCIQKGQSGHGSFAI